MSIYSDAAKIWGNQKTGLKYRLYIRFSPRVNVEKLAKDLGRKGVPDFGTDKNDTLSASWVFKTQSKNFMLYIKRQLKKDKDIKEITIREIK